MSGYPKVNYYDWLWKFAFIIWRYVSMKFDPAWSTANMWTKDPAANFINEVVFLCRSLLQPDMDLNWMISEEERTRHDALFYSQRPQDRYLSGTRWNINVPKILLIWRLTLSYANVFNISGEQARSLFIRSKLPLPELSKIWLV